MRTPGDSHGTGPLAAINLRQHKRLALLLQFTQLRGLFSDGLLTPGHLLPAAIHCIQTILQLLALTSPLPQLPVQPLGYLPAQT